MFKEMFLQASLTFHIFSVITFIIVPTISETICGTTNILLKTGFTCQKKYIKHLSLQSNLWLILYDVWATVLVNVSVSDALRHT